MMYLCSIFLLHTRPPEQSPGENFAELTMPGFGAEDEPERINGLHFHAAAPRSGSMLVPGKQFQAVK